MEEFDQAYGHLSRQLEVMSVTIFTVEYLLRIWACVVNKEYRGRYGRLKYMTSFMSVVDLIAILLFFIPLFFNCDIMVIRVLRLMRIFRLFKMGRYSHSYDMITRVLTKKSEELCISIIFIMTLFLLSSCGIYLVEHEMQPKVYSSIPASMWWSVVTTTTVGYGDMAPVTAAGRLVAGFTAVLGVCLFAIPAGIITAGFVEELKNCKEELEQCKVEKPYCPHCGHHLG